MALRWVGQDYLFWQQLTLRNAKAYHKITEAQVVFHRKLTYMTL